MRLRGSSQPETIAQWRRPRRRARASWACSIVRDCHRACTAVRGLRLPGVSSQATHIHRISPVRVIFFTAKRHHRVIPAIGEVTRISGISVSHSEAAYTNSDKMQTTAFRVILITPMLFICTLSRGHSMGRDFLWCLRKSKNIEFLGLFVSDFQFQLLMSGGLWAAAVQSCLKVDDRH